MPFLKDFDWRVPELMTALVLGSLSKFLSFTILEYKHKNKFKKVGTVSKLYIFPIKSCGYYEQEEAVCTRAGLRTQELSDRHWMLLNESGESITSKMEPKLMQVKSESNGEHLRLQAPGLPPLDIPKHRSQYKSKPERYILNKQPMKIYDCGQEASDWISKFLGKRTRIVFSCPEIGTRDVYERERKWDNTARPGDMAVFAYLTSYLVTTTASLNFLNESLDKPVQSLNFRPNIVIDAEVPFDEDNWRELRIGDNALFHHVEPCRRCLITTQDPDTGEKRKDRQPLELLRSFRCRDPYGKAPLFGIYMANDVEGQVKVGDPVFALMD